MSVHRYIKREAGSWQFFLLPGPGIIMRMNHYYRSGRPLCSPSGSALHLALSFKPLEIRTFNFLPLPAFENWPLPSMGFSRQVSSDSTKPHTLGV